MRKIDVTIVDEGYDRKFVATADYPDRPTITAGGSPNTVLIFLQSTSGTQNILLDWDTWNDLIAHVADDREYFIKLHKEGKEA